MLNISLPLRCKVLHVSVRLKNYVFVHFIDIFQCFNVYPFMLYVLVFVQINLWKDAYCQLIIHKVSTGLSYG